MPHYYASVLVFCIFQLAAIPLAAQTTYPAPVPRESVTMPAWQPHPILKGAASMTLAGDRSAPGMFALRFKYPDGLHLPPHVHATDLHTTVLQGLLCVGFGEKWDTSKVVRIMPGQFMRFPAGKPHFEYTIGETILHVAGMGPMQTTFNDTTAKPFIQPLAGRK